MNTGRQKILFLALLLAVGNAYAEKTHHPGQTDAPQAATNAEMHTHMQKMQAQLEAIRKADDQAAREKLIDEHLQSMHEGMGMMRGMQGGMMSGGMMQGEMMQGEMMQDGMGKKMDVTKIQPAAGGQPPVDMQDRMRRMEERQDMMQEMMDQMIQSRQIERRHDHRKFK